MAEPALSDAKGGAVRTAVPRVAADAAPAPGAPPRVRIESDKLTAMYGKLTAVKGVSLSFTANRVHAPRSSSSLRSAATATRRWSRRAAS